MHPILVLGDSNQSAYLEPLDQILLDLRSIFGRDMQMFYVKDLTGNILGFGGQEDFGWVCVYNLLLKTILSSCMGSCFSHAWLCVTPWTTAHQAPLSMGILQARILEWIAMPFPRGSSQPRIKPASLVPPALAGGLFTTSATWGVPK